MIWGQVLCNLSQPIISPSLYICHLQSLYLDYFVVLICIINFLKVGILVKYLLNERISNRCSW